MKAKKHIEFDRVFAYLTEGKTDVLWFENEDVMRRAGECLFELIKNNFLVIFDRPGLLLTRGYDAGGICVKITHNTHDQEIRFASEKQMRRAGQCLIDLARIGGNEVEIKDEEK